MSPLLVGEALLEAAGRVDEAVIAGDAARCLWMLETLPGRNLDLWKRICHPWPATVDLVGAANAILPEGATRDTGAIAREFEPAMVRTATEVTLPAGPARLVAPAFVLAEILLEEDPLKATRLADLLRCLEMGGRLIDLEDVRVLLKAVRAADRYELLVSVARVI